jgi:hypothetical protein
MTPEEARIYSISVTAVRMAEALRRVEEECDYVPRGLLKEIHAALLEFDDCVDKGEIDEMALQ